MKEAPWMSHHLTAAAVFSIWWLAPMASGLVLAGRCWRAGTPGMTIQIQNMVFAYFAFPRPIKDGEEYTVTMCIGSGDP